MKTKLLILFLLTVVGNKMLAQNNMGIGTENPDPSAILDISDTTKGVLVPRVTSLQRLAIPSPANGLLVYDLTENCFQYYSQPTLSWISMCNLIGPTGPTGPSGGPIGPTGVTGPTGAKTAETHGANATSQTIISSVNPNFTDINDLHVSVTLNDSATLNIFSTGGLYSSSNNSGSYTGARIQIFCNNVAMQYAVQSIDLNLVIQPVINRTNWAISCIERFPPGIYSFQVKGCNRTGNHNFIAGALQSQGGQLNSASLIVQVFY